MSELKSIMLLPYCPLPVDQGAKAEMGKTLECLRELGPCTLLSARRRPVGMGWSPAAIDELKRRGFGLAFEDDEHVRRLRPGWAWGMAYAAACKTLGLERAFGHANPYHRLAFDPDWFARHSQSADLALIHYSYWARLPCACPKVVVLHDLLSDIMWGGAQTETRDLKSAALVVVISKQEEIRLRERGIARTVWSPPFVAAEELPDSDRIGIIGSSNAFNREGLRWLGTAEDLPPVKVFGQLSRFASRRGFEPMGRYDHAMDPYRQCGIVLMTTSSGTGVQIKTIESLAAGRAIVARRGAMRGIPPGDGAWIVVDTPEEMWAAARRLAQDRAARARQMAAARDYYRAHLDVVRLRAELKAALARAARESV